VTIKVDNTKYKLFFAVCFTLCKSCEITVEGKYHERKLMTRTEHIRLM